MADTVIMQILQWAIRDLPGVNKACPSFDVKAWLESIGIRQ